MTLNSAISSAKQKLFFKNYPHDPIRCKCGAHLENHYNRENIEIWKDPDVKWDYETDTKTYPTNAYGEIDFLNEENDLLPYVSSDSTLSLSKKLLPIHDDEG